LDTTNAWTLQNQYTYTPAGQVATKALSVSNGAATASGLLTTSYTYDGLGTLISTQYPSPNSLTFTYALDGLERPIGLTDNTNHTWVSGVVYNPASQMTNAMFPSGTEMWGYNTLNQLTQRMTTSGSTARMNVTYAYPAGKDNGQIAGSTDAVTGETITYLYDSLKRLAKASSGTWSDTYTYDGFGNLTGMAGGGGAPSLSVSVNPATNQITPTNIAYDGNGNVTQFGPSGSLTTMAYNVANRMATVNATNAYAYDPASQRVYFRNSVAGTETLYVYGTDGKKLATYTIASITGSEVNFTMQSQNVYFAGKLISAEGNAVAVDRLGTVRWNAASGGHTYYPYGVEYSSTANDTEKYATYTRDTLTGLDYAMNRYYSSTWGRFMAPDPSHASMHLQTPLSWNRYTYTLGDPIGGNDPTGLDLDDDGDDGCPDGQMCFFGGASGGGSSDGWGGGGASGGIGGSLTTGDLATDINGNPIVDQDGNPIVGDVTQSGSQVTVNASTSSQIFNLSITTSAPFVVLGGVIGSTLYGPPGGAVGAVLGSMCGVGGSLSIVPGSTTKAYAGPTLSCGVALFGGSGAQGSITSVPSVQDPNQIANGFSSSITYQPTPFTGSTVTKSPGSGPPVIGISFGTKVPVSVGIGYNWCIWNCQP
jgi:RHS repeat-associated protein